jgi:hypothetical protein
MPTYKFEEKDRVFFFKNDMSDHMEIDTLAIGKITSLRDNQSTPYCYNIKILANIVTEEEGGLITRNEVPTVYSFNEHQLGFLDSTLYSEDYKFHEDYYRVHQMVKVLDESLMSDISETDVGIITKIKRREHTTTIWIRTASGQNALDLDNLLVKEELEPLLLKDLDKYNVDCLRHDLKSISKNLYTYEDGGHNKCSVCSEWVWEQDDHRVTGHGVMCQDCWHLATITCYGCENVFKIRNINHHYYKDNDYCGSCYDNKVFRCVDCSLTFQDLTPFLYDDNRYCKGCYETRAYNLMSSPSRMLPRSRISKLLLPADKSYNRNKSKTAVAIEIEAVNNDYSDMDEAVGEIPHGWNDIYDGSITSSMGREFVMLPEVGDTALNKVKKFCDWLKDYGWHTNSSCGIHVHTDAYYLGVNELKGILLTVRALEPLIYSMLPKSRSESRYSKPMDYIDSQVILDVKSISDLCQLWYETMNDTHASSEKYNDSRYRGFNLHSRFLHGTIEYRYHHGTVNPYYINNWILFCLAISDFGTTLLSKSKKTVNLFVDSSANKYTVLLEAMGISNLIPYVEEMIDRSAYPSNQINSEDANWSSHV